MGCLWLYMVMKSNVVLYFTYLQSLICAIIYWEIIWGCNISNGIQLMVL